MFFLEVGIMAEGGDNSSQEKQPSKRTNWEFTPQARERAVSNQHINSHHRRLNFAYLYNRHNHQYSRSRTPGFTPGLQGPGAPATNRMDFNNKQGIIDG